MDRKIIYEKILEHLNLFWKSRKDVISFAGKPQKSLIFHDVTSKKMPAQKLLGTVKEMASIETVHLVNTILEVSKYLCWKNGYSEDELGKDFVEKMAWFDLISPEGPFLSDNLRVMIGFWGDGLHYKIHSHFPAEIYVPIAGSANFWSENSGKNLAKVGDIISHKSNERHSIMMDKGPLLSLVFWKKSDENQTVKMASDAVSTGLEIKVNLN